MQDWATRLAQHLPELEISVAADETAAAVALSSADAGYGWVPPHLLSAASHLRLLQSPYAGPFAGFYYPQLIEHPLTVCNVRGIYSDHIAQHIAMYMLALARDLPSYLAAQREGRWDTAARQSPYLDLSQATVLIVGLGGIGAETARICQVFGCEVLAVESRLEQAVDVPVHAPDELLDLLGRADFVISTLPHTPATEMMWNTHTFAAMRPGARFINIGRGMTTRLADLVAALESGHLAGAALDVFEIEPLPAEHALWRMPNVIITPHVAIADADNITERRFEILLENVRRFVANEPLLNVVDKALWY
ncbi:MAG: D-2-hydroxyacid dehydrogenase [Pseudomonadota bacterium]